MVACELLADSRTASTAATARARSSLGSATLSDRSPVGTIPPRITPRRLVAPVLVGKVAPGRVAGDKAITTAAAQPCDRTARRRDLTGRCRARLPMIGLKASITTIPARLSAIVQACGDARRRCHHPLDLCCAGGARGPGWSQVVAVVFGVPANVVAVWSQFGGLRAISDPATGPLSWGDGGAPRGIRTPQPPDP